MGNMDSSFLQVAVFLLVLPLGKGVSNSYSAPVIKLEGRQFTEDMLFVYQLECSTTTTFHGCSVEMLLDDVTKETIRYFNYTCYKGNGVCSPFQCGCADECNKFLWNYTVKEELKNNIFKCDSRIQDNGYFYRVFATGVFEGGDFVYGQNAVEIVSKNHSIQKVLTEKELTDKTVLKEQQNFNDIRGLLIAVLCLVCLHLITCMVCSLLFLKRLKVRKVNVKKKDCGLVLDDFSDTYNELSQDEDFNSEENHPTCSKKKPPKNKQDAETCRSNTDKSDQHPKRKQWRRYDKIIYRVKNKKRYLMSACVSVPQNGDFDSGVSSIEEQRNTSICRNIIKHEDNNCTDDLIDAYGEISQDEEGSSEDTHPICSKKHSSEKTQPAETCRSNADKTDADAFRKTRRSDKNTEKVKHKPKRAVPAKTYYFKHFDYDSEDSTNEGLRNCIACSYIIENEEKDMYYADVTQVEDEISAKTDQNHMSESGKPLIPRKRRTRTNAQVKQKQIKCTNKSSNTDADYTNGVVVIPAQIDTINCRPNIDNETITLL